MQLLILGQLRLKSEDHEAALLPAIEAMGIAILALFLTLTPDSLRFAVLTEPITEPLSKWIGVTLGMVILGLTAAALARCFDDPQGRPLASRSRNVARRVRPRADTTESTFLPSRSRLARVAPDIPMTYRRTSIKTRLLIQALKLVAHPRGTEQPRTSVRGCSVVPNLLLILHN